jgi:hypothetical protein
LVDRVKQSKQGVVFRRKEIAAALEVHGLSMPVVAQLLQSPATGGNGMLYFAFARILAVLILSTLLAFVAGPLFGAQVTLTWDAATGQSISGYKIYYGTASRNYTTFIDAKNVTSIPVTGLQDGTKYYFAATVYNEAKVESGFSNEVTYTTPAASAPAPSGGGVQTCTYSLSSSSASFGASAGNGSVAVTAPSGCAWSSSNGASWITATAGAAGAGNGTFTYSVAANTTSSSRAAALTIAGKVYTVTQAGLAASYTITASAGTGGTISPSGSVTVAQGSSKSFTIASNPGYYTAGVTVDGTSVGAVSSYTFSNMTANHTISATFANLSYTLILVRTGTGWGSVTTSPSQSTYLSGTTVTLTASPSAGSTFTGWSGACSGTATTCTLTMQSNKSVTATFALKTYTITSSAATAGGSISPSGTVTAAHGSTQVFTITPGSGYKIANVRVDGAYVGAVSAYTFWSVTGGHTIAAFFSTR